MAPGDRIIKISIEPADGEKKKKTSWWQRLFGIEEEPDPVVPYKGYSIRPAPQRIAKVYGGTPEAQSRAGKWQLRIFISKGEGGGSREKEFNAANAYKSKKEAIHHCIEYGKQIIDGKSQNFKVDDL